MNTAKSATGRLARRMLHGMPVIVTAAFLLVPAAVGQQTYVTRYDAYVGYAGFNSPAVSLPEHGVQMQVGVRPKPWISLGFDYSFGVGTLTLKPDLLTTSLQTQLGAQLAQLKAAGMLPSGYVMQLPADSTTQTFAAGPQFAYRRWSSITLFLRPSCGLMHEKATLLPQDAITTAVVKQLAPSGVKKDWAIFYGFGGGVDLNFSRHVSLRMQADLVRDHLFDDVIRNSRGTVRFSIGPAFNFGRNIVE